MTRTRSPLPDDPETLPRLPDRFGSVLDLALIELGIELTSGCRVGLEAHVRLLLAWNQAINLTAVRDPGAIALAHVADSLAALPLLRTIAPRTPSLLDLGSGAGYPGLPLALALPASRAMFVDSVGKKSRFLAVAAAAAMDVMRTSGQAVPLLTAEGTRAEDLAADASKRAAWDVVTVRAVGSLAEVAELALPLLRVGGTLVAWKRDRKAGGLAREIVGAAGLVGSLGGWPARVVPVLSPAASMRPGTAGTTRGAAARTSHEAPEPADILARTPLAAFHAALDDHVLVAIEKRGPTPTRYPRPPAERRRLLR